MAEKVIEWEWDVETVATADIPDAFGDWTVGDILDHDFHESYASCLDELSRFESEPGTKRVIVLVRTDFRWRGDPRCWAYLRDDGTLPEYASDADGIDCFKVPKRYHAEVAKANKAKATAVTAKEPA